jgi:hypothetical protein
MGLIKQVAEIINELSPAYLVGKVPQIRKEVNQKPPRTKYKIFAAPTIHDDDEKDPYAFNDGGRDEIQVNIGYEDNRRLLRHGLAFSLETSPSLTDPVGTLRPYIDKFNIAVANIPYGFSMWHYERGNRSGDYLPQPIPQNLIAEGNFIFVGTSQLSTDVDLELILEDLDKLMPLYVETLGASPGIRARYVSPVGGLKFKPGNNSKKRIAAPSRICSNPIERELLHNEMQDSLYRILASRVGKGSVGTENLNGYGQIDAVVLLPGKTIFYEIKTSNSPRICIREAIGQLLEYSYWPNYTAADELVIVGPRPLDSDAATYISTLRAITGLNLAYASLDIENGTLT